MRGIFIGLILYITIIIVLYLALGKEGLNRLPTWFYLRCGVVIGIAGQIISKQLKYR